MFQEMISTHRSTVYLIRVFMVLSSSSIVCAADGDLDYAPADPALKVVRIDHVKDLAYIGVRVDTAGRIFVGGREKLFVYEPDGKGGYLPRHMLYEFPPHGWVFDIEIRGHDLYVMTASALYLLPEAVTRREGITVKRLIWGQPLGHIQLGFHGLAWGPQGDLYFSMGDPLQHYGDFTRPDHWGHWTLFSQPEGTRTPYTGVGGIFRCRPDGSGLRIVSRGSFNNFGLAFDRHWNLFTDDHDREAMPAMYVPARLLHVTPHSYFGWPRGWMVSKTPDRADLLETMYGGLGRAAPVGVAYYDDALLPASYRNQLLVARWAKRAIDRFSLIPRGASFRSQEHPLLIGRREARPMGVCVDTAGRIFATIGYLGHLAGSPTYDADLVMLTTADDHAAVAAATYDATESSTDKLWSELSNASWQRRYRAHVELLRRGGALLTEATERATKIKPEDPAIGHLLWLSAISGTPSAGRVLMKLSKHPAASVRLQAVRALADSPNLQPPVQVFERALSDSDAQVRLAGLNAFFDRSGALPPAVIEKFARSKDTYLRQAATLLLAERSSLDALTKLCRADDTATRLAGVLAAGFRLTLPPATKVVPDDRPLDPYPEQANVIQYADEKLDLRTFGRVGNFTTAEHWKAGQHTDEQEKLFALLLSMLTDSDDQVRLQAAHFLHLLNDDRSESRVADVIIETDERRLAGAPVFILKTVPKVWVAGPFSDGDGGLETVHPPETGPVDLAAKYACPAGERTWDPVAASGYIDFRKLSGPCDGQSFYAYWRFESAKTQSLMLFIGSNDGVKVWHNGREVWKNEVVRRALPYDDMIMLRLQPGGNEMLVRVHNETGACGLNLNYKTLGDVVPTLPEKLDFASLAERLESAGGKVIVSPEMLQTDWSKAMVNGDAERGRKLFSQDGLGCAICHPIRADQAGGVGPSLAEAGKRFTIPQLVQSILLPSKQVSPVFRASLIELNDGAVLYGMVIAETGEKIELITPDTKRMTVNKQEIVDRKLQELSPMPEGIIRTADELGDILTYLLSAPASP